MQNRPNPFSDLIPQNKLPLASNPAQPQISTIQALLDSFNLGAEKIPHGLLQFLFENKYAPDKLKLASEEVAKQRQQKLGLLEQQAPISSKIGGLAGGVASSSPFLAIPGLGEAGTLQEAALTGLTQGAATGGSEYVNPGDSRISNAFSSGLLGAGIGTGLRGIGMTGAKVINAIGNKLENPEIQSLIDAGKKYAVSLLPQDISKNLVTKGIGSLLDKAPYLGTKSLRQQQMNEAKNAASFVTNQYKDVMDTVNFGGKTGLARLQEAAAGGGNRAKQAQDLLQQIQNSGHDWNQIMQTSGNLKLFRSKLIADRKYDILSNAADELGNVDTSNIIKSVDNMLTKENSSVLKNNDAISLLSNIKNGLTDKQLNFTQLRQLRSDLSDSISDYFTGANAAIGKKGVGALQAVKDQIDKSLNSFAQNNGERLKTLWKNADGFYKNNVIPAKDKLLANALKNADPDEVYAKFITTGTREGGKGTGRAAKFYNALDEKGRAAIRYGMVSDAFEKAIKEDGQFSPAQFAGHLDRYTTAKNVVFNPTEKAELDGFKKLMRATQKSYQELNQPETGVKTIPYIMSGALLYHPLTAVKAAAITLGLKQMFMSDAGKKFLLASSKIKEDSPAFTRYISTFGDYLRQGMTLAGQDALNQNYSTQQTQQTDQKTEKQNPFADLIPNKE